MAITKKVVGRIPVCFGEWYDKQGGWGIKNRVTMYGSEFESLHDANTVPPAVYDELNHTVTFNDEDWGVISNGTEAWLADTKINDLGTWEENVEFARVYLTNDRKLVWGIQRNGNVVYGAGVPEQVKSYITAYVKDKIDNLDINSDFTKSLETIPSDLKVSILGDSVSTFNQEGYKIDGYEMWYPAPAGDRSADVTSVNDTYWKKYIDGINAKIDVNASCSGSTASSLVIGFSSRVRLLGSPDVIIIELGRIDSSNNVEIGQIDYDAEEYDLTKFAPAYIKGMQDVINAYPNARIICVGVPMNQPYIDVIKAVAEHYGAIYFDFTDVCQIHPNKSEMQAMYERAITYNSQTYDLRFYLDNKYGEYADNPEFVKVLLDNEGHILFGIRKDGDIVYGYGIPSQIQEVLNKVIEDMENIDESYGDIKGLFNFISNPEFLLAVTDSDNHFLFGITIDGKLKADIPDTPELAWIKEIFSKINDPDGRMELTLDEDDKILGWRDKDGVRHEQGMKVEQSFSLGEGAMTEFQQALKDAGFQPGGGGDFSDRDVIELPEPKTYGLLNLIVPNLPLQGAVDGYAEYYDKSGNYFKIECSIEPQGQSSQVFAQTGGKGNYTLDTSTDIKFGDWVPQDSFHLKGAAKDVVRGILPTSYKWAYLMQEFLNARPNRILVDESGISTTNATGNRMNDWPDDARCLPDGFPCELYVNGEYWGLYSWQLKKHRKNYSMDKKDYTSLFIDADLLMNGSNLTQGGFWADGPDHLINAYPGDTRKWWNGFDIKGPKDLICMDGSEFDGDNPQELIDETSPVYDSSNKKHKGSRQAKNIIRGFSTKYLAVKTLIDNDDIPGAKDAFEANFDYNACMLVYIFNCLMYNLDSINKNTLWGTYANGKVFPMLWDLDAMYGEYRDDGWIGTSAGEPNASAWEGLYAISAWPLALFHTLYADEIKAAYASLREARIISVDTWHDVVFNQWVNRIGKEAFERDIKKWPETPSYREDYTNADYWEYFGYQYGLGSYSEWNQNTSYSVDSYVALSLHPQSGRYFIYKAVQASDANNPQCPVTQFYTEFPQLGGFYDSPKRWEKWITQQIALCDTVNDYSE